MRIFHSFLLIVSVAILWMVPFTEGIYDFRTDVRADTYTVNTEVGDTTTNVTLHRPVYDDDSETISVISSLGTDSPTITGYTPSTRSVGVSGLSENTTRTLTASYDVDALDTHSAIDLLLDIAPILIILLLVALPPAGLVMIWKYRA